MARTREERKREIVEGAYEVFGAKGFHETGIADIAKKLALGHGTIYRYFDNKEDVFARVIDLAIEKVGTLIASEDPGGARTLGEYQAQLERIGDQLYSLFIEDPHLGNILFGHAPGFSTLLEERLDGAFELFRQFTGMYLANGKRRSFLRADLDVEITSIALNAIIFESLRRVRRAQKPERAKRDWVRAVTKLMLHGMAA
jgi:AcrR family transcriptional regulator